MFAFPDVHAISADAIEASSLQNAMLVEISMARAESEVRGDAASWNECLKVASLRQRRHFDARIPEKLEPNDISVANHAARNLVTTLDSVRAQSRPQFLNSRP